MSSVGGSILRNGLGFKAGSLPLANSENSRRKGGSSWGAKDGGSLAGGDLLGVIGMCLSYCKLIDVIIFATSWHRVLRVLLVFLKNTFFRCEIYAPLIVVMTITTLSSIFRLLIS